MADNRQYSIPLLRKRIKDNESRLIHGTQAAYGLISNRKFLNGVDRLNKAINADKALIKAIKA